MLRRTLACAVSAAGILIAVGCGEGTTKDCVPVEYAGPQPGNSGHCQSAGGVCSVSCSAGYHEAPAGSPYVGACNQAYDPAPNGCGSPPVQGLGIASQVCCLPDSDGGGDGADDSDASRCQATSHTDLPGVHIDIDASRCVFTLAQAQAGIAIGYDVVVDADVPNVVPRAQDAGNCDAADQSGLMPFESLAGASQRYCLCDVGLCRPPSTMPITLLAGRYHHTFTWDGKNWTGPSDTGNPEGAPFPAGMYTLTVSAAGTETADGSMTSFTVSTTLPITLVP